MTLVPSGFPLGTRRVGFPVITRGRVPCVFPMGCSHGLVLFHEFIGYGPSYLASWVQFRLRPSTVAAHLGFGRFRLVPEGVGLVEATRAPNTHCGRRVKAPWVPAHRRSLSDHSRRLATPAPSVSPHGSTTAGIPVVTRSSASAIKKPCDLQLQLPHSNVPVHAAWWFSIFPTRSPHSFGLAHFSWVRFGWGHASPCNPHARAIHGPDCTLSHHAEVPYRHSPLFR